MSFNIILMISYDSINYAVNRVIFLIFLLGKITTFDNDNIELCQILKLSMIEVNFFSIEYSKNYSSNLAFDGSLYSLKFKFITMHVQITSPQHRSFSRLLTENIFRINIRIRCI